MYYLQSRYYNPEWGRFINADAIIGQTGELLGHNMFAYCKNNPINMSDKSGFRPIYTMGEETEDMRNASVAIMATVARNNASTSTGKGSFNLRDSALKSGASGLADTITGKVANNFIKERKVWKDLGSWTIGSYVSNLSKGTKLGKTALGIGGTIGFCAWDINKSLQQREYLGVGIDILAAILGVAAGAIVAAGSAAIITASTPALLVGAIGIAGYGLNVVAAVGIDMVANEVKDKHYGR